MGVPHSRETRSYCYFFEWWPKARRAIRLFPLREARRGVGRHPCPGAEDCRGASSVSLEPAHSARPDAASAVPLGYLHAMLI